jgi:hypothetical protein
VLAKSHLNCQAALRQIDEIVWFIQLPACGFSSFPQHSLSQLSFYCYQEIFLQERNKMEENEFKGNEGRNGGDRRKTKNMKNGQVRIEKNVEKAREMNE